MPENNAVDDVLIALRDIGVNHSRRPAMDRSCLKALDEEIKREQLRDHRAGWRRGRPRVWIGGALGVVALAGTAVAIGDGILARSVPPGVASKFAILRRPVGPGDVMPANYVSRAADPRSLSSLLGVNPLIARRAHGVTSGAAWVLPAGPESVCLALAPPGTSDIGLAGCNGYASAVAGRLALSSYVHGPRTSWVAGLVPDDVTHVTLKLTDGTSQSIAVHDNVYTALIIRAHAISAQFTRSRRPVALVKF